MKALILVLLLAAHSAAFSQRPEFAKFNGLIYPDSTITRLKHVVDSLNLKFKVCELHKVYQSRQQAKAHHISLEKGRIREARKDMEAKMPFELFIKKYPKAKVHKQLLVIKEPYFPDDDKEVTELTGISLSDEEFSVHLKDKLPETNQSLNGTWLYRYYEKTGFMDESIDAFYFTEDFSSRPLPVKYARMVQYSDCMVDTSTQVFFPNARYTSVRFSRRHTPRVEAFYDYINESIQWPDFMKVDSIDTRPEAFIDSVRYSLLSELERKDTRFQLLLKQAIKEAIDSGSNYEGLEEYAGHFLSKKTALELKRNRIVIGGCSQDEAPRLHAFAIAKLAAETVNWEIFLRSHLDIMNDRFERMSDGSYAQRERLTYIQELEVLDINVIDLLLGISLRMENPSANHYYGNIGRLGRALSETKFPAVVESTMLQMISDKELDDYNRVVMYYLFQNYNHFLDQRRQQENTLKLKKAVQMLPVYLTSQLNAK